MALRKRHRASAPADAATRKALAVGRRKQKKWLEKTLLEATARVNSRPAWAKSDLAQQEIARLSAAPSGLVRADARGYRGDVANVEVPGPGTERTALTAVPAPSVAQRCRAADTRSGGSGASAPRPRSQSSTRRLV